MNAPLAPAHFSLDWLEMREALDARSRSRPLTQLAREWLAGRPGPHAIVDLGSGSGSNLRFLAPRLPGPQRWRLVDHDAGLLDHGRRQAARLHDSGGGHLTIDTACRDLAPVDEALLGGADLVVASALFDLVSRAWVEALVAACVERGQALLLTLSVDGDWAFLDRAGRRLEQSEDIAVRTLFQAHQYRDKGLGDALGGEAPAVLATALREAGFRVQDDASPWRLEAGDPDGYALAVQLVRGWHAAALEQTPAESQRLDEWRDRRLAGLAVGELGVTVGHRDLFAAPAGG
jgi:SAM-dependent methyltransferase